MTEKSMKRLNLAFRFILEMLALVALFLLGMSLSDSLPVQLVLALCLPALALIVWGMLVAPKATRRLDDPARLVVELGVWLAGALAFGLAVSWMLAVLFGLAVIVSLALMFYWGQRGL
jgi:hypothetical protein